MQHKMETKIIGKKEEHLKTKKTEASVKLWDSKFSDNNQDTAENDKTLNCLRNEIVVSTNRKIAKKKKNGVLHNEKL